ncbi:MAG: hypothetical protein PHU64_07720 [Candidatus Omnitrophica bacterium]|nr:hypothetical protein [Candidatus Omnitrophota bacterium]
MTKSEFVPGAGQLGGVNVTPLTPDAKAKVADAHEVREFLKRADSLGIHPLKMLVDTINFGQTYPISYRNYLVSRGMLTDDNVLTEQGKRTIEFSLPISEVTGVQEIAPDENSLAVSKILEYATEVVPEGLSVLYHNTELILLWEQFVAFYLELHSDELSRAGMDAIHIKRNILSQLKTFSNNVEKYGESYLRELTMRYNTYSLFMRNRKIMGYNQEQIEKTMGKLKNDLGTMEEWLAEFEIKNDPAKQYGTAVIYSKTDQTIKKPSPKVRKSPGRPKKAK